MKILVLSQYFHIIILFILIKIIALFIVSEEFSKIEMERVEINILNKATTLI